MAELLRVAMVAGEASGDQLAASLIAALKARRNPILFAGIGGPRMQAQGFESHYPMDKLSVRGYAEVALHYHEIMSIRRRLVKALLAERPDVYIGVDASEFNLGVEAKLKNAGIPAIHYVSPQVWAWRGWRVRRVARSVTRILVMFPFEAPLYEKIGVPVTYVGHPLADLSRSSPPSTRRAPRSSCRPASSSSRSCPAAGARSCITWRNRSCWRRTASARKCTTCTSSAPR